MWIREETRDDIAAIREVVAAAFAGAPGGGGIETRLVDALRAGGALALSLVADIDGRIAGHVAFSPARPAEGEGRWYALAPVAVAPADQGHGVGAALIRAGLRMLEERAADGCVVLGDPAYYARFGFGPSSPLRLPGAPEEAFQALRFTDTPAAGAVRLHPAFAGAAGDA